MVSRHQRDEAIRREFNGRNYDYLAMKHRLTVRQIRRITGGAGRLTGRKPVPESD